MKNKLKNKILFAAILMLATAALSFAAGQTATPDGLVADLYKQHNAKKSPFFQTKSRTLVSKYFTKATTALIWKDATTVKNEVGALDGDPLYDAQDMEIKNFKIGKAAVNGSKAKVAVTFDNFGEKRTITYSLVKESGAWKIDDINYQGGYTLVGMFKEDAAAK